MILVSGSTWARVALFFLAVAICATFYAYGYTVHGYHLLKKYPPDWSVFGGIKAIGLLAASMFVYLALRPGRVQSRDVGWSTLPTGWLPVGILLLVTTAAVLIYEPKMITEQMHERKSLNVLTELLYLAALVLMALALWFARRSDRPRVFGAGPAWLLSAIMLVIFLIVMEEMSWGQHWIGFSTPDLFEENLQNETNIHNFHTHQFEAAYYSAAVLAFVVLPFAWPRKVPAFAEGLTIFIPPPAFAILALPLCGLFYQTWNYVMNQVWFYLGLLIAVHLYRRESVPRVKYRILLMGSTLVLSQVVFLQYGHTFSAGYELTEIRELAIPLAFVAYGIILFARFRRDANNPVELTRPV